MRYGKMIIDLTEKIRAFKKFGFSILEGSCEECGENPCICGSKAPKEKKPCKACEPEDTHENLEQLAKKDAGYPPNCKKGFVEKGGKCVPEKKDEATHDPRKKGFHASKDDKVKKEEEATHDPRKKGFHASKDDKKKKMKKEEAKLPGDRRRSYSNLWKKVNKKDNI